MVSHLITLRSVALLNNPHSTEAAEVGVEKLCLLVSLESNARFSNTILKDQARQGKAASEVS